MSRMIAGDYGGVFGLERPGRVFSGGVGGGLLLLVLFESSEEFFFCSAATLRYNKKNQIWGAPLL